MSLTIAEETYVKKMKKNSDVQQQIQQKNDEMWSVVENMMAITNDGTQWKKRGDIKIQYRTEIEDLKKQIVEICDK